MTSLLTTSRTHNAMYECCAANDRWPTLMELAKHLQASPIDVHASLNDLTAKRMVRQRDRDGRRVWVPWSEG